MSTTNGGPERVTDARGNAFELRPLECPVCGPAGQKLVGYRGGRYQRNGEGVATRVVRCRGCTLLFSNPFPYPLDAQKLYGDPEKYFESHDPEKKVRANRRITRGIVERGAVGKPSVLDIGSGRGELLHAAQLEGLDDVVGLEFSDAMIAHAREHYGVELVAQTIEEYAEVCGRTFDAVVLNAVIEHVYDPDAMIAAVRRVIAPGAIVYVDVPQDPNLLTVCGNLANRLRLSRAVYNLAPTWPPYHVFGFSQTALRNLLGKHGIEVDEVLVHANPRMPGGPGLGGRLKGFVATQINRLANVTGTAANMCVWARCVR